MKMDSDIFPPVLEYKIGDDFNSPIYHRRYVHTLIDGKIFSVVYTDQIDDVWNEPEFVILRGNIVQRELGVCNDIIDISRKIMQVISQEHTTKDDITRIVS